MLVKIFLVQKEIIKGMISDFSVLFHLKLSQLKEKSASAGVCCVYDWCHDHNIVNDQNKNIMLYPQHKNTILSLNW